MNLKRMVRRIVRAVRYHGIILITGFLRMVIGTGTAGAFAMAGYGFFKIPSEGGYIAVMAFLCAVLTLGFAVSSMYTMGGGKRKGVK